MQAYPSVGSLYEGNLGGVTGVGGGPNPKPLYQGVKYKVIVCRIKLFLENLFLQNYENILFFSLSLANYFENKFV